MIKIATIQVLIAGAVLGGATIFYFSVPKEKRWKYLKRYKKMITAFGMRTVSVAVPFMLDKYKGVIDRY